MSAPWGRGKGTEIQIKDQRLNIQSISIFLKTSTVHKYLGSGSFLGGEYDCEGAVLTREWNLHTHTHTHTHPFALHVSSISLFVNVSCIFNLRTASKYFLQFGHK